MPTIRDEKLNQIKKMYDSGMSVQDIATNVSVSLDAAYYFFRKHGIKRRGIVEARHLVYSRKKPSFKIKKRLSYKEKELKTAGVMLYWGEGSKWDGERVVDFANSNSEMIKIFLSFLRIICGIKEDKVRIYLYCYSNQSPDKLIDFWSKEINVPKGQFTKPYIRNDYNKNKTGKMKYGLIHIRYADKKLLNLIREWINEYVVKFI